MLNSGLDKLLGGYVRSEVIDRYSAALHHDLYKVFADIVHISAHCSDNGAAYRRALAALADHIRLQKLGCRRHAARSDQHLRNENAVCREIVAELVHSFDKAVGEYLLRGKALVERLFAQRKQLLLLAAAQRCAYAVKQVIARLFLGYGLCLFDGARGLISEHTARHRRQIERRRVKLCVVFVYRLINIPIDMPEHCAGNTVGYRRDKMSARAAGVQRISCISKYSLAAYILPVDGGSHAAHENELSFKVALQCRNIVLRKRALPYLNADLGHIVNYRHKIGIRMVHGNAAARADIAVKAAVRLFEKLAPHIRLHEQRILRAPVVV
ncbi:unknown [Firmicutes bacterium CAG:240]|nr:unknown [Firmicutes bacterium CAG:240]